MQREEVEVIDDSRMVNEDLNADLAQRLSHKRGEREARQRALAALKTELAELGYEHQTALHHEKGGLDDLLTAKSVHDAQEADLAYEEWYADTLIHMEDRLKTKKLHFEKRLAYLRSNLIIVTEDLRVYAEKREVAKAAEKITTDALDVIVRYAAKQRAENQTRKQGLVETLRGERAASPEPIEELPQGLSVADEMNALRERQVVANVNERQEKAPAQEKEERYSAIMRGIVQVTGTEDVDEMIAFWENSVETAKMLGGSQTELEAKRDGLNDAKNKMLQAEDMRQQQAAESESYGSDTRLKDTERRMHVVDREREQLAEKAGKAEMLHRQAVEQLDAIIWRVAMAARAAPPRGGTTSGLRNHVLRQQMLLESISERQGEALRLLANPPKEWTTRPNPAPRPRRDAGEAVAAAATAADPVGVPADALADADDNAAASAEEGARAASPDASPDASPEAAAEDDAAAVNASAAAEEDDAPSVGADSKGPSLPGRRLANVIIEAGGANSVPMRPRPPANRLEALRLEARDLTTRRGEQLCTVLECRLQLFLETMGGIDPAVLDDAAKAASMAPKPPPGLARQSTQAIQKANPNVRVTSQRESRYANPDAADDTPLSELLARRGSRFDDVEEEEEDTTMPSFKTGRNDAALAAAKKDANRPTLTPTQKMRMGKQGSGGAATDVLSREVLKQRSAEVTTKSLSPKKSPRR